jgi:hypothetical protein
MPRVETTNHHIQRAFSPLIFRTRFAPERLLTPPPLPWHASFPPHGDGKPAQDLPLVENALSTASSSPLLKRKRPAGEPGRTGGRGFNLKLALDLPEDVYETMLVGWRRTSLVLSHLLSFTRAKFTGLLGCI